MKQTRSLAVNPNIKIAFTCLANILGLALDELSTGEAFPAKTTTGIRATECNRYQQMLIGPTGIHATGWFAIDPTSCRTSACSAYWTPCFCHFSTFDADQLGWPKWRPFKKIWVFMCNQDPGQIRTAKKGSKNESTWKDMERTKKQHPWIPTIHRAPPCQDCPPYLSLPSSPNLAQTQISRCNRCNLDIESIPIWWGFMGGSCVVVMLKMLNIVKWCFRNKF